MTEPLLPNISDFIAHVSPLNALPQAMQQEIASHILISYLGCGQTLPFDEQACERYLYIVRTGSLEQRWRDGALRARLGPEDLFGFTFLEGIPGDPANCYNVTAIENTLLYQIPHSLLKKLLAGNPQYATHFSINAHERLSSAMNVVWSEEEKGLFVRKVSEIASGSITVVEASTSIQETARQMRVVHRSSTAVVQRNGEIIGIISDRDMTRRVVAEGLDIQRPVSDVMTPAPITVSPDALVMHAASLMMQHNVRGLPIVKNQQVTGLLTTSHLVQQHRVQAIFLIEKINLCDTVEALATLKTERQAIFEALVNGSLRAEVAHLVMSMIMDAFTRRLIQIAEVHFGPPPCDYAWVVAGSHARNEVHMGSDQDSALILSDDATESDIHYFVHFAMYICNGLDACGYVLCSGQYMATVRRWCQPVSVWKSYFKKWVTNPEYGRLLSATVFLEMRSVQGNAQLCETVRKALLDEIAQRPNFVHALTRDAITVNPPLGIFNNLVLEKSGSDSKTFNIKRYALTLIIDLARIYGLASGCEACGTEARFEHACQQGLIDEDSCTNIIDAWRFLSRLRLTHQLTMMKQGMVPDNNINPANFGSFERKHLKDAFRIIARQQDVAKLRFVKE